MAIVTLDGLTKRYDAAHPPAADTVSLEIADGEFMVLLGPSGCGKTTTLRMIAGLESISSGVLSIDGQTMNDVPAKDRDIAMVFQSYALYPHMSVRDNLGFGLKRRRVPRDIIRQKVDAVAETLKLSALLDRRPHALSGGQRQRVALGRAIVRDPKVFLFDEPLSNLDAALRVSTRAEISELHRRLRSTMIYVTHDQVEAMTMGGRICIMNEGKVMQVGRPMDVYRRPVNAFVAGFLGNPPMNLMPALATDDPAGRVFQCGNDLLRVSEARTPAVSAGQACTLGIRPEHVTLHALPHSNCHSVPADIVQVEPLGAETIVTGQLAGLERPVLSRVPGEASVQLGERCTFHFDLSALHVFDSAGQSLTAPHLQEAENV